MMHPTDLSASCPGLDPTAPNQHSPTSSIGDYIIKFLQKTFEIIKSSPNIENEVIVDFVKADLKDSFLPFTEESLAKYLKCSEALAINFFRAQSKFLAVSFEPQEYKYLGSYDSVPFVVDTHTYVREVRNGMVEKVVEGGKLFVRKTISVNYDLGKIIMKIKILRLATETGNPYLLRIRCDYKKENHICLVMYPWCECDLDTFRKISHKIPCWTQLTPKEKLVLITDWMSCLESGLSALHRKKKGLKPENMHLDADLSPVIFEVGIPKTFKNNPKSFRFQDTCAYYSSQQLNGNFERNGNIFALGLIFLELGLLFFGQKSLDWEFASVFYMDITKRLAYFLEKEFPMLNKAIIDDWNTCFQSLIRIMLDVAPENRPKESEVWKKVREIVEAHRDNPHCNTVFPVGSTSFDHDGSGEDPDFCLRKNFAELVVEKLC